LKFQEITSEQWPSLQPYLDTCVIPYAALSGEEQPPQVVAKLARLRDLLDWVEIPFKGRVVTYPAIQYELFANQQDCLRLLVQKIKQSGFRYVVIVSVNSEISPEMSSSDLVIHPEYGTKEQVQQALISCWKNDIS
jgi:23S rRNA (pseudouridine1915-N3)-methyltransferase